MSEAETHLQGPEGVTRVTPASPVRAVTFDFGLTLCELDTALLAARLGERGVSATAARLEAASDAAWHAYDAAVAAGLGGHPWKLLMTRLLEGAGVAPADTAPAVDWLWTEQPRRNLWRRPIPGMIELCRELAARDLAVGVVSNSEGKLAELIAELDWSAALPFVADSGVLGIEKPDPAIFRYAAERLGVPVASVVHVGDSGAADVDGAVGAGMRAIWFRPRAARSFGDAVRRAEDAEGVRAALAEWGVR
jgi:putative hydrolase of the HAD superfamily